MRAIKFISFLSSLSIVVLFSLLMASCGQRDPHFYIMPTKSNMYQGVLSNNKVDVLWVIDNSGSMFTKQQNLANSIESFVTVFANKGFDFHFAVTTTDVRNTPTGQAGHFVGTPTIVTNETPNLISKINSNTQVGINGNADQHGFEAITKALSDENLAGANAGFIRDEAFLAVIVLTDADVTSTDILGSEVIDRLNIVKPDVRDPKTGKSKKQYSVSAIVADDLNKQSCIDLANKPPYGAFLELGTKYIEIAAATGGTIASICDTDFSAGLLNLSTGILKAVSNVKLAREPEIDTISVLFNGVAVPKSETNGWTYDATDISINFHGDYIPGENISVDIDYTPKDIVR